MKNFFIILLSPLILWTIILILETKHSGAHVDMKKLDDIIYQLEVKNTTLNTFDQSGDIASWYDYDLPDYPVYSQDHDTCASRDYPRGTMLKVEYQGKIVVCRVNDYGPEEWTGRQIDLSSHAFSQLADLKIGLLEVKIYE